MSRNVLDVVRSFSLNLECVFVIVPLVLCAQCVSDLRDDCGTFHVGCREMN